MIHKLGRVAAGIAAAVAMVVLSIGPLTAQDKKEPKVPDTIGEIMKKGHASKGLLGGIAKHAKEGSWEDAQNDAKLLKAFGEGLAKLKPEMGSEESWKKLTDKYKKNTVEVFKSAQKKDAKEVTDALGKLRGAKNANCKECHDAHKGG